LNAIERLSEKAASLFWSKYGEPAIKYLHGKAEGGVQEILIPNNGICNSFMLAPIVNSYPFPRATNGTLNITKNNVTAIAQNAKKVFQLDITVKFPDFPARANAKAFRLFSCYD
jgi:hypothetical protein